MPIQFWNTGGTKAYVTDVVSHSGVYVSSNDDRCLFVVVSWSGGGSVAPTSVQFDNGGGGVELIDITGGTDQYMTSFAKYRVYSHRGANPGGPYNISAYFNSAFENASIHYVDLCGTDISTGDTPIDTPTGPTVTSFSDDELSGPEPSGSTDGIILWAWAYVYDPNPITTSLVCNNGSTCTFDTFTDTNDPGFPITLGGGIYCRLMPGQSIGVGDIIMSSLDGSSAPLTVAGLGIHSFNIRSAVVPAASSMTQTILIM